MSKIKTFNPSSIPTPPPTYNQIAKIPISSTHTLITIAGQVGIDATKQKEYQKEYQDQNAATATATATATAKATKKAIPPKFLDQVSIAYQNLYNSLLESGARADDIIHVRHYIVTQSGDEELDSKDILDRGWGDLWVEFLDRNSKGHRPPDTVVGVVQLAVRELLYEVEVSAVVENKVGYGV